MSGKLVGMVFEHYPGNGGGELLLAVKLADNAHDSGAHIFPSVATLAEQTRQSERTVQYQLKRMVAMGWLQLMREAVGGGRGGGFGRPREYRIHPDWIKANDARTPEAERPKWDPAASGPELSTGKTGADSAPNKNRKWVQPSAEMGATAVAEMGAIAVAPEPSLTVKEPIPPVSPTGGARVVVDLDPSAAFDEIVGLWPETRRLNLKDARQAFDAALAAGASGAEIVAAARRQCTLEWWTRAQGRFVPKPAKWLREERWLDSAPVAGGEPWQDSRKGVEAMAAKLGMPAWDRSAFDCGRGESWRAYRLRVIGAAQAPQRRVA